MPARDLARDAGDSEGPGLAGRRQTGALQPGRGRDGSGRHGPRTFPRARSVFRRAPRERCGSGAAGERGTGCGGHTGGLARREQLVLGAYSLARTAASFPNGSGRAQPCPATDTAVAVRCGVRTCLKRRWSRCRHSRGLTRRIAPCRRRPCPPPPRGRSAGTRRASAPRRATPPPRLAGARQRRRRRAWRAAPRPRRGGGRIR